METLPSGGATFAPVTITEGGRRLLASLLGQLSDRQLTDLFTGARFDKLKTFFPLEQTQSRIGCVSSNIESGNQ